MRVAVFTEYGPAETVSLAQRPRPTPKDNEVLIRVHATTVNSGDARIRGLRVPRGFGVLVRLLFGMTRPRLQVLGTELAGEVVEAGDKVSRWRVGDKVFADKGMRMGAHAEYVTMPEDAAIAIQPTRLKTQEAAALSFGGTTALYFLKQVGKVQPGERVLINGATGTVGSAAIQLAKHWGAEVTAVCSRDNAELAKALGADRIIDYAHEDFAASGDTWDVIMDNVGNAPWSRVQSSLTAQGRLLLVVATLGATLFAPVVSNKRGKRAIAGTANAKAADLACLAELAEAGHFTPLIDQTFALAQIQAAHARVDSGRKRGSVVVLMATGEC